MNLIKELYRKFNLSAEDPIAIIGGNPRFNVSEKSPTMKLVVERQDPALLMAIKLFKSLKASGKKSIISLIVDHIIPLKYFLHPGISPNKKSYRLTDLNPKISKELLLNFNPEESALILKHSYIYFEQRLRQQMSGKYDSYMSSSSASKNNILNSIGIKIDRDEVVEWSEKVACDGGGGCETKFNTRKNGLIKIRCKAVAARAFCLVADQYNQLFNTKSKVIIGFWTNSKWSKPQVALAGANLARMLMGGNIKIINVLALESKEIRRQITLDNF